jgi:hypothetical protein
LAAWSPAFHCHERKEKPPLYLLWKPSPYI